MTQDFHVTIRRDASLDVPALHIAAARSVSAGTSADGTVTVLMLRGPSLVEAAAREAEQLAAGARRFADLPTDGSGIVVLEHTRATVTVVAAPIGLRQLFWSATHDALSLTSNTALLPSGGNDGSPVAPDALFHYVYFHAIPGPVSVFGGIRKLESGHTLSWDGGVPRQERYWRLRFNESPRLSVGDAARELHRLLADAVRASLDARASAGAFLSGGLDSSTVAGVAAQQQPGLPTVSMGFDAEGYDEMPYARIASRHFRTRPIEYYVTPDDVLHSLPRIAAAFPEPFGNSSAAAAYQCARVAREHGIELMLAGDGGDELFGGNERYSKQLVFERYGRVPGFIRNALLEPTVNSAAALTRAFPIGKAQSYIQQANVPLPDRLQAYNFLHRHDPAEVFTPGLLAAVDATAPLQLLREEYAVPETPSAVNRMLFLDWKFTLHDNDLVKVNTMCRLAGVDVAYPLLDQRLVDFAIGLPGNWKVRHGELRWFYKEAMRGFLPEEILRKKKHGFGLPFGVWMRTHEGLRRLAEDALGSLATRGYFNAAFLETALARHREQHASYYGELVWILTALELWLRARRPNARL